MQVVVELCSIGHRKQSLTLRRGSSDFRLQHSILNIHNRPMGRWFHWVPVLLHYSDTWSCRMPPTLSPPHQCSILACSIKLPWWLMRYRRGRCCFYNHSGAVHRTECYNSAFSIAELLPTLSFPTDHLLTIKPAWAMPNTTADSSEDWWAVSENNYTDLHPGGVWVISRRWWAKRWKRLVEFEFDMMKSSWLSVRVSTLL